MTFKQRISNLLPGGKPRYIRVYDDGGKSYDRYTVVFTHADKFGVEGQPVLAMSSTPFHPQGFCQHNTYSNPIDKPAYGHLGKKITYDDLPPDCQKVVYSDYCDYWALRPEVSSDTTDLPLFLQEIAGAAKEIHAEIRSWMSRPPLSGAWF